MTYKFFGIAGGIIFGVVGVSFYVITVSTKPEIKSDKTRGQEVELGINDDEVSVEPPVKASELQRIDRQASSKHLSSSNEPKTFLDLLQRHEPGTLIPKLTAANISQLRRDIENGDEKAAHFVARALDDCEPILRAMEQGDRYTDRFHGQIRESVQRQMKRREERCEPLLALYGEYSAISLQRLASKNEFPAAKTWLALSDPSLSTRQRRRLAIQGAASGHPQALADMAEIVAADRFGTSFPYDRAAWLIAACRQGFHCASNNIQVRRACNVQGDCPAGIGLLQYLSAYELPPALFHRAQQEAESILFAIETNSLTGYFYERYGVNRGDLEN